MPALTHHHPIEGFNCTACPGFKNGKPDVHSILPVVPVLGSSTVSYPVVSTTFTEVVITPTPVPSQLPSEVLENAILDQPYEEVVGTKEPASEFLDRAVREQMYRELGGSKLPRRSLASEEKEEEKELDPHRLPGESDKDFKKRRQREIFQKYGIVDRHGNKRHEEFAKEVLNTSLDNVSSDFKPERTAGQDDDEEEEEPEKEEDARKKLMEAGVPEEFAEYLMADEVDATKLPDLKKAKIKALDQAAMAEKIAKVKEQFLEEKTMEGRRELLRKNGVPDNVIDIFLRAGDKVPRKKKAGKKGKKGKKGPEKKA